MWQFAIHSFGPRARTKTKHNLKARRRVAEWEALFQMRSEVSSPIGGLIRQQRVAKYAKSAYVSRSSRGLRSPPPPSEWEKTGIKFRRRFQQGGRRHSLLVAGFDIGGRAANRWTDVGVVAEPPKSVGRRMVVMVRLDLDCGATLDV